MGLRQTYRRSSQKSRKRGGREKWRRFMIPPTIREEEEEAWWDSEGNPVVRAQQEGGCVGGEGSAGEGANLDSSPPTHSGRGAGLEAAPVCHQVVDLSILEQATPKKGYRKNKVETLAPLPHPSLTAHTHTHTHTVRSHT